MPANELSRRFTLHDIFGHMFPGLISIIGFSTVIVVNRWDGLPWMVTLLGRFRELQIIAQSVVCAIASYVVGLVCLE